MLEISILKVENPSCLWGRVVCGADGSVETTEHYTILQAQMNLFYHDVTQNLHQLKPTSLEEGQVYVVYWAAKKSWCRAVVRSVITDPTCCRAFCFLVDHGEMIVVSLDKIRVPLQKFLQLPFWVRRFHLARIQPITLRVSILAEKVELEPSKQWDFSATLYLHNLLRASTQTEAVLHELESDSTSIELYLTISNIKICVNDDLVANRFACYSSSGLRFGGSVDKKSTGMIPLVNRKETENFTQSSRNVQFTCTYPYQCLLYNLQKSNNSYQKCLSCERSHHTLIAIVRMSQMICSNPLRVKSLRKAADQRILKNQCSLTTKPSTAQKLQGQRDYCGSGCLFDSFSKLFHQLCNILVLESSEVFQHCLHPKSQIFQKCSFTLENILFLGSTDRRSINLRFPPCCSLLEWLNPEPFNSDPDAGDDVVSLSDPWVKGILVHSALSMEPCNTLEDAPITDSLRQVLLRKNYHTLSPADRYSWPAVARGCNTFVISQNADQPLGYLIPLLTHILLNSLLFSHLSSSGPIAVLLCPGWEKAQMIYNLLEESKVSQTLHPIIVLVGIGKDEAKAVKFPKNCLLLVTTPFTLVRLLSCHCFLFLRLYHLVLDEADQLFTFAPDEMGTILQHFQKVTSSEEKASCPRQLVAVSKRWTSPMDDLISKHMLDPSIVITVPEEAALYGNIQQVILMTIESNKISALLGVLDFSPEVGQKTLIVTNSAEEVEDVFKAVSNKSAFCLKIHKGLLDQLDFVIQQWSKSIGPGTHVILVSTSECLGSLGIRDAACVVHYGFPPSPKVFGYRLFCMAENFRNLPKQDQTDCSSPVSRSVLLISERNARHVVGVLRYLERTDAPLPPVLFSFAEGVHVAREDQKSDRPFCSYLKSFGFCRDRSVCPDRHRINPRSDQSALPASGVIEVLPLYIKTASVFYGRLVRQNDKEFDKMASEMMSYYADKKPGAKELLEGALYAVEEDEIFHRVKILALPDHGESIFYNVLVRFIDIGKESDVKSHQILELPSQFHSLPNQAIEMVVCRVKPADAEIEWHPKVTRAISQKIRGLQHRARAVLCLGNTVFVDPMVNICFLARNTRITSKEVRVTQMPGTKTCINEYNVQTEILKTGMGVNNPKHLDFFRAAFQDGSKDGGHISSDEDRRGIYESNPAASLSLHENDFPLTLKDSLTHCLPLTSVFYEVTLCVLKYAFYIKTTLTTTTKNRCYALNKTINIFISSTWWKMKLHFEAFLCSFWLHFSLYPQVVWYQTCDSVIVTVKLMNPESQRCNFYTDRVVYSGRVNSRSYRADLELHQKIDADICHWEMKSNQPVLKLVKQQQGHWERLIRSKNIFVSYDMDHVDDDEEDKSSSCRLFVENIGEDSCYLKSESGSD
uniref:RNA helicase n=1 Tax=Poecilia formosa TaxID=48698 RepID=A0A087XR09_POEFO